jgi:hypothetical protein
MLAQPAAPEQHVASGDIENEKTSFDTFSGKAEIESGSNFEYL